jgi:hypothetical protein
MPGAQRGKDFLLDPADRQHQAAQRNLAGHRHIRADGLARKQRDKRQQHRDNRRSAHPSASRPRAHAHDIRLFQSITRPGARKGERGLRRFLHHVAKLPGQDQLARSPAPWTPSMNRMSPPTGVHGEAGRYPGHRGAQRDFALELCAAEDRMQVRRLDVDRFGLCFGDLHRRRAQHRADFALEVAHARLARVVATEPSSAPRR